MELMRSAWDGLRTHKLRSGLTALGVIFGVAAVIGMSSIGEGARREALKLIESMGASNIIIQSARPEEGEALIASLSRNPLGLSRADLEALKAVVGEATLVAPFRVSEQQLRAGSREVKLNVVATTPQVFPLYGMTAELGRILGDLDQSSYRRVCVLGWEARRELFPLEDPLGSPLRIGDDVYTVVGVTGRNASGGGKMGGVKLRDRNRDVYIPLSAALKRKPTDTQEGELSEIVVHIQDPERLRANALLVERILQRRHHDQADFKVVVPEELLRQHQATQRIFNIVMGTIASISLLVGGIGIMNIMLASVLERTREIGVRRAVGARQSDIARQFLAEAVLLSLFGGLVGVILGLLLSHIITLFAGWETAVSLWAVLLAVGVSMGVGIVFGWLPARNAAKLDPIAALRYE